jgi:hypothetical protein
MTTFWFVSIASLFNFVSTRKCVSDYYILTKQETRSHRHLSCLNEQLMVMIKEDK